jgi:hypothetical protein
MTSVNATTAATPTTATSSTGTSSTSTTSSTTSTKKSFDALFAEAKDDLKKGEKLSKVDGHQFGRIKGGERDDMCLNLTGNARSGKAFDLIWRDGRQFHVYGTGKDRQVVEVGHKAATTPSTTGAATTDSTSSTGTTTDSTAATGTSTTGSTTTAGSTTTGGTKTS